MYYYRNRYYSPELYRFLTPDVIGIEDDINLYRYVKNNPLVYVDPLGNVRDVPMFVAGLGIASMGGVMWWAATKSPYVEPQTALLLSGSVFFFGAAVALVSYHDIPMIEHGSGVLAPDDFANELSRLPDAQDFESLPQDNIGCNK